MCLSKKTENCTKAIEEIHCASMICMCMWHLVSIERHQYDRAEHRVVVINNVFSFAQELPLRIPLGLMKQGTSRVGERKLVCLYQVFAPYKHGHISFILVVLPEAPHLPRYVLCVMFAMRDQDRGSKRTAQLWPGFACAPCGRASTSTFVQD